MNKAETVKKLSASISPLRKLLWFSKRHAYLCGVADGHSSRDEEVKELESERDHWQKTAIELHIKNSEVMCMLALDSKRLEWMMNNGVRIHFCAGAYWTSEHITPDGKFTGFKTPRDAIDAMMKVSP